MALFWLSLTFFLVMLIGSLVFLTVRGLRLFRAVRGVAASTGEALDRVGRSSEHIQRHLELASESGTRLEASLARLRESRARLAVQRAAVEDVRALLSPFRLRK